MLFGVSIILLLAASLLFVSFFQYSGLTRFILQLSLTIFSFVVLTAQISGFLGLLSNRWFFLILQMVEIAILLFLWFKKGRPGLFPFRTLFSINSLKGFFLKASKYPVTSLFFLFVTSGYGVLAWLILTVPPNNSDSMHTHLARVIYWLQQSSFKQLTCSSIYAKIYPFDAQLNILWTILFTKSDKYVGFIQFFSAIICAISIYGISRLLKGSRRSSLIVGLFFLTFPLIVFEATSTQFDLVVSALFTCSLFFFFDHYKNKKYPGLFFSGLALGLAVGTKETVFMMGPALLIIIILILYKDKTSITWLLKWATIGVLGFLALGSFTYFNNWHYYGNPLGPSTHVVGDSLGQFSFIEKIRYNTPRFFYQFISFDSLPTQMAEKGNGYKNSFFKTIDSRFNLGMESSNSIRDPNDPLSLDSTPKYYEDESWFGLASVLLLSPAFILGIYYGIRRKDLISISLVIFGVTFYLFEILLRPGWDPYQGRYFILAVAAVTPLVIHITNEKLLSKIYTTFIGIIVVITFATAVFSNELKPILGAQTFENYYIDMEKTSIPPKGTIKRYYRTISLNLYKYIWKNSPFYFPLGYYDDTQLRTLSDRNLYEEIVRKVDKLVPPDGRMGVMLGNGAFDYVFFGPKLERVLINLNPISLLMDPEWIQSQNIPYILIHKYQRIPIIPDYLNLVYEVDGWGLYAVDIIR